MHRKKTTEKILRKNNLAIAINIFCAKNDKIYRACVSKQLKAWKKSYSFNDFTQKRMTLYCGKKKKTQHYKSK